VPPRHNTTTRDSKPLHYATIIALFISVTTSFALAALLSYVLLGGGLGYFASLREQSIATVVPQTTEAAANTTPSVLFQCSFDGAGTTPADKWRNCGGVVDSLYFPNPSYTDLVPGHLGQGVRIHHPQGVGNVTDFKIVANVAPTRELTVVFWE
jgi:hypothetical protein